MSEQLSTIEKGRSLRGSILAITCYCMWGILPLYWKLLQTVPPLLILAHRIVWALVFSVQMLVAFKRLGEWKQVLKNPKSRLMLVVSTLLITVNWGIYIWAVNNGQVVESALGYFINPLVLIFLGLVFFRERLNIPQVFALILAAAGVIVEIVSYGKLPWVALSLAFSFGLYGLCKKVIKAESLTSLSLETLFALPLAAGFFALTFLQPEFLPGAAHSGFGVDIPAWIVTALLVLAGPMTAMPLWAFGGAARLIPLSTVGFFQYLSPTIALLLGTLLFKEEFGLTEALSFGCIWAGLIVYSVNQFINWRRGLKAQ